MDVFYCLIHTPEAITPELRVLAGDTEADAVRGLAEVARDWPRLERIDLYRGNQEVRSFAPSDFGPATMQIAQRLGIARSTVYEALKLGDG